MKYAIITILSFCIFFSCTEDEVLNSNVKLQFSSDTITFDTVFASVGSITKTLTIYNNNSFDVSSNIKLQGISAGNFRMNIDGTPGNTQNNIVIPENDSIFIFIEVTINPFKYNSLHIV